MVQAARARGWHYIGVGKWSRRFQVGGQSYRPSLYGPNVLRLPPIRQLKADLLRTVWREAVNDVAKVSHERPVLRRLEKLLAA